MEHIAPSKIVDMLLAERAEGCGIRRNGNEYCASFIDRGAP